MRIPIRHGLLTAWMLINATLAAASAPDARAAAPSGSVPASHAEGLPGAGAPLEPALAAKLDPRLWDDLAAARGTLVPVWLTFADKGERDPASLAARLAEAEAALTPRARARRLRAHVEPLVDYRDLPVHPEYLTELRRRGMDVVAVSRWLNRAAVRVPADRLGELAELSCVAGIAPVERAMRSPSEPAGPETPLGPPAPAPPSRGGGEAMASTIDYGANLSALAQMNVPAVHDSGYIGTGVLVCIIDDGFNYHDKHEALRTVSIAPGRRRDFVQGDTIVIDTTSATGLRHGTWVMGCVAGNRPGAYVGSGFGAEFALARTEVDASETPVEMLYWGMGAEWADSLGADIITSSLGYFTFDNPSYNYTYSAMNGHTTDVSRAAEIAASKGILVLNAVGNEGVNSWHYLIAPSDVAGDSLVAVGAVDQNGVAASFSSYGPSAAGCIKPDLAARGVGNVVVSITGDPNTYMTESGTSFATPLVAGLAACLMQARPVWSPTRIAQALRETASRSGSPDNRIGWGIPNGLAALRWAPKVGGVTPPSAALAIRLLGPNPLRSSGVPLTIQFGLGEADGAVPRADVRVYDPQGRRVRELFSGPLCCRQTLMVSWNGRNGEGARVHSGLYEVVLETGGLRRGARVIVLP